MLRGYQKRLVNEVIDNKLCSGCGTCAGVCAKGCVCFNKEHHTPVFDGKNCINCGLCYDSCPGKGFAFNELKKTSVKWDDRIGPYIGFITSHATDELLRKNGASGGTVSAIFQYVLKKGIVQKVLCVKKEGEEFKALLTDDVNMLKETQGSKYIPVPLNAALREVIQNEYAIAVVGTPCELQGIYLAAKRISKLNELIRYKIGIFCGFAQSRECLTAVRKYLDVADDSWRFDGWRCGEYPGYVRFTNEKTKEQRQLIIYDVCNLGVPFYSMEKCFMCPDGTNMCADFSFGDIHSRGKDENSGIVRTERGAELIASMKRDEYLHVDEITLEEAMGGTVGAVAYLKGMRSLLYIQEKKNAVPLYDVVFDKNDYKNYLILQNKIQMYLYRMVRKPGVKRFFEKHPVLQMRIGRYAYTFPNRVLLYKILKAMKQVIKRN